MQDPDGYTPEELRRLGLAGRGPSRIPEWLTAGLAGLLRALRPPWPGLGRTILVAIVLSWIGFTLFNSLQQRRFLTQLRASGNLIGDMDTAAPALSRRLLGEIERAVDHPLVPLARAGRAPWRCGLRWLALPFALIGGLGLYRARAALGTRLLGCVFFAAGGIAAVIVALGLPDAALRLFPFPLAALAGATAVAWLLYRTPDPARASSWRRAAPSLVPAALLAAGPALLLAWPGFDLRIIFGLESRPLTGGVPTWVQSASKASRYTQALLGFPLLLVPALVVGEGLGFGASLRRLGRALLRRPVVLLLAHAFPLVVVLLPIGPLVAAPFLAADLIPWYGGTLGYSVVAAVSSGLELGLLVWATSRFARVLVTEPG